MSEQNPPYSNNVFPFPGRTSQNESGSVTASDEHLEQLRSDLFFDKVEALFKPLAGYVERSLATRYAISCRVQCSLVDGEYKGEEDAWACYHLDATYGDQIWCFNCIACGYADTLCTFDGEEVYFDHILLDDQLEAVATTILRDAAQCLSLLEERAEQPPPDTPTG